MRGSRKAGNEYQSIRAYLSPTQASEDTMRVRDNGCYYSVSVSQVEVATFNRRWPCSSLPERSIAFQFDKRNGDLVDIWPDSDKVDGPEALALSQDAQAYGRKQLGLAA
jgi:hypothetical protein